MNITVQTTTANTVASATKRMLAKLKESGLSRRDAEILRMVAIGANDARKLPISLQYPGFKIPYFDLKGRQTAFWRYRYLPAVEGRDGKSHRYVQPPCTVNELYLPPFIDWIDVAAVPDVPIVITEGELKAACACRQGLPTIGLGGVRMYQAQKRGYSMLPMFGEFSWSERKVYIAYDSDAATNPDVRHAEAALARALAGLGAIPHVVRLPSLWDDAKTGLDDFLVARGKEPFEEILNSTLPAIIKPTIKIVPSELPRVVDEAEAALIDADLGLYQRGAAIVRPAIAQTAACGDQSFQPLRLPQVNSHHLIEAMTLAATFVRGDVKREKFIATDCPMRVAETYLARVGRWKLPPLKGIINAPTLRIDGSILDQPGYDGVTQLLYDPQGVDFGQIEARPSKKDAFAALKTLRDLIATFPFVSNADRAVALSAILTAIVCRSLPACPLHGFTAPTAGSGKSMLVDLVCIIATGQPAAVIAQGKTEEELEKRLDSALLAGDLIVCIDNCEQPLGGEKLCSVITGTAVKIRPLGRSELVPVPSDVFVTATGNNLVVVGDMTRRTVLCALDPKTERPELRHFDVLPTIVAANERPRFVQAAVTIMHAFWCADRPRQASPFGSFEDWSRWVREPLIWLGEADPVETADRVREDDPKLCQLTTLIEQWEAAVGNAPVTAKAAIEISGNLPDFREALLAVAYGTPDPSSKRLGDWLAKNKNRVVADRRFVQDGITGGVKRWRLDGAIPVGATSKIRLLQ